MKVIVCILSCISLISYGQNSFEKDSTFIRNIYNAALSDGDSHKNLESLCKDVGHRLTASKASYKAIEWGKALLESYNFDTVYLQEITVPHWERGSKEKAYFIHKTDTVYLSVLALGGSVGTDGMLSGEVIEYKSIDDLIGANPEDVKGKIVFINESMDPNNINTFRSYGGCYRQRAYGAKEAAKHGAIAVLTRSLSLKLDNYPHTGSMRYEEGVARIPAAAISTMGAVRLKSALMDGNVTMHLEMHCKWFEDTTSYNVIADINGKDDKIILVGGHLDSWDVGEGAHDDGAGIIHSIEALRLLKDLSYTPNHTIRCVLYMNEENGNYGGEQYADYAKENSLYHIAALESDRGGFSPRGFSLDGSDEQVAKLQSFEKLLSPYNLHKFQKGYGGVDIGPLKNGQVALIGLVPDSQRYFDHHHAQTDLFENVNKRELELGSAACASLLYLIDQHGID